MQLKREKNMDKITEQLNKVRQQIDAIDLEIQKLVVKRAEKIKDVSRIKQQDENAVFYRPEREANLLKKVMARDCGILPPKEVAKIFREIMSACLALQKPMQIAFLGPAGTFSQFAAQKHFGSSLCEVLCDSIPAIFQKVAEARANYGVVPIENNTSGLIELSLHEFINSSLTICGEVSLDIKQCLFRSKNFTHQSPIKKIYSHQQSLLQCQHWLSKHYPDAELIAVNSNAVAAKHAADEAGAAAIAGEPCGELYNLELIAKDIADQPNNRTRFLIIGHHQPEKSGDDRTSLLITVHDAPGALEKLINPLAKNNINITMIRSLPANNNRSIYYFFLDLDCYQADAKFLQAQQELTAGPMEIKILGSYPKAAI